MTGADGPDDFGRLLQSERLRNGARLNALRLAGCATALVSVVALGRPAAIQRLFAIYLALALTLFVAARRHPAVRAHSWLALPLMDVPAFVLARYLFVALSSGPALQVGLSAAYLMLLLLAAQFSLRRQVVLVTTAVASVCEAALLWVAGFGREITAAVLPIVIGGAGLLALSDQVRHLMERYASEHLRREQLKRELDMARQIQMALLPDRLPELPGYALHAVSLPSRTVSGDLYVVRERAEGGECVLLVADVSGKGMPAALLTASLEALSVGPIEAGLPASEMCEKLSRRLHARTNAERYATAFVAVLEAAGGRVVYANAGHNPALLVRSSGECHRLGATGIPLGLLPAAEYTAEEIALLTYDTLVVYTDGITEAANGEGEEYGLERLENTCREHLGATLPELAAAFEADIDRFTQGTPYADDRTLLLLRRLARPYDS